MMRQVIRLLNPKRPAVTVARWSERRPLPPPPPADDEDFDVVLVLEVLADSHASATVGA